MESPQSPEITFSVMFDTIEEYRKFNVKQILKHRVSIIMSTNGIVPKLHFTFCVMGSPTEISNLLADTDLNFYCPWL